MGVPLASCDTAILESSVKLHISLLGKTQSDEQPNQLVTHSQPVITQPHVTQSVKMVEPNYVPGLDVNTSNTPTRLVYLYVVIVYNSFALPNLISMVIIFLIFASLISVNSISTVLSNPYNFTRINCHILP